MTFLLVIPAKPESSAYGNNWIPAFAGMTA